ncbi:MAG: hypothetical protein HOV81_09495 [Kofleriaceae bacterium]|nr:hypothetical protein [Kofleriaceae bacterium]
MRALAILLLLGACDAASPELGLDQLLQVEGAQFRPGPFPAADGGPATVAVTTTRSRFVIGQTGEAFRGVLEPAARGAVIGLDGVDGTWLVAAGPPDVDVPGMATAKGMISLAPDFPAGPFELRIAASDDAGRFGESATAMVVADEDPPPAGELVIGLAWDGRADLDIHVVDGLGGEAWTDDPNTWQQPAPGEPVDPVAYLTGGILDHDGNKGCNRDARPTEHVIWQMPPPDGDYIVRVDARSMCADASAAWYVDAYRSGALIGASRGVSTYDDTILPHGKGAGVLALRFSCSASGCTLH